ncbi:hypothetical protein POSPLADRAFT_1148543 [Postia placenta MAD-698-R-SB12]|uniref:Cation/H+ exchanger transmembrane domain-containing protein n=1 Tax=Postia placenta MAD-698-R-SB12 TaxID=670580 RepID=A0A1X6MVE8_9APHY|nr:hypothetical protein POSPLADRAFT_1148543 [Postia placenta MAD-698-R-SB12]OSX60196.1 hypothetical protein POSPLADRAFT_1148543 [Postia placenta MAD-698-R-SB12]
MSKQPSIFNGLNPSTYNASDPFPLWVIQVVVIIGMTQLLALILGRIRQPRVISEVIGGVLLGPSVMGRIPGFSNTVFPNNASIAILTLTADIGLILFLFLVGLEIDVRVMRRNARASIAISLAGLIVPLGLGAALAVPIYHNFIDQSVNFGYFILFVAVAVGITAFPVLCRILTELKLVDTTVGVVVLAAGVGNDIIGWVLLALTVALVNSSKGITALWILLAAVAYILFLTIPVRWGYRWLARRTGSLETGQPSLLMMTVTVVIIFISAFYTDIIGIHPIFGGFLAGLIIPHDNGYAIALVEKVEDLVSVLLLPLYFALSGLRTNLGLLNNGITWGYTILICVVSFFSKFLGCSISARLTGFSLRESGAIGSLMACKGLVELIALNIGLQAGILNTRVFSMFVLHALVTTFVTTPLVLMFYPERFHVRVYNPANTGMKKAHHESGHHDVAPDGLKTRFTVALDRVEQLPAAMTLAHLLHSPEPTTPCESPKLADNETSLTVYRGGQVSVNALRLIPLSDRTSAVFKSHETESLIRSDTILSVFGTFGHLNRIAVSSALSVLSPEDYSAHIINYARETASQMIVLPWTIAPSSSGAASDNAEVITSASSASADSALDGLFQMSSNVIRKLFIESPIDVALFVDRSSLQPVGGRQHVFLPFFGGADDRLALTFVAQLCMRPDVTATVLRVKLGAMAKLTPYSTAEDSPKGADIDSAIPTLAYTPYPDTVYAADSTQTRLESDTADDLLWGQYVSSTEEAGAAARMSLKELYAERPLHEVLQAAREVAQADVQLLVVAGRSRRTSQGLQNAEVRELCTERGVSFNIELSKTMGDAAAAFVVDNVRGNLLVMQRAQRHP